MYDTNMKLKRSHWRNSWNTPAVISRHVPRLTTRQHFITFDWTVTMFKTAAVAAVVPNNRKSGLNPSDERALIMRKCWGK